MADIRRLTAAETTAIAARIGVSLVGDPGAPTGASRTQTGPGATQAELDADPLLKALHVLGLVQNGPRSSPMGPAYDIECPWSDEHTDRATTGTIYAPVRTKFRCHHGHCDARTHEHLRQKVDELLRADSGGTTGLVHFEFDEVDPMATPLSPLGLAPRVAAGEARFLADTIYVRSEGRQKFWSVSRRISMDDDGFNTTWADTLRGLLPPKTTPAKWYRSHPDKRIADDYVSWPGGGVIVERHGRRLVNRWIAPATLTPVVTRIADQDVEPWLSLAHHVLGATTLEEAEALEHALDWMAMIVGSWTKPGWHVLVTSDTEGLGKDVMLVPIVRALGDMATEIAGSSITDQNNPWAQARFVQVNEMKQTTRGTSTANDQMNVIKLWDSTRETVRIKNKYTKEYDARNIYGMWFSSNELVPLRLARHDRRLMVFNRHGAPLNKALVERYVTWMDAEVMGAFKGWQLAHAWLVQRWVSLPDYRIKVLQGHAPLTSGKTAMIDAAMDENEVWLRRVIDAQPPSPLAVPDVVSAEMLVDKMSLTRTHKHNICSVTQMGQLLAKVGAVRLNGGMQVRVSGERVRLWAVRNAVDYEKMSPTSLSMIMQHPQQNAGPSVLQ